MCQKQKLNAVAKFWSKSDQCACASSCHVSVAPSQPLPRPPSLPVALGMFTAQLEKTGAFLCGDKVTIADLQLLPQLRYFTRGVADFVPADSLAPYPVVIGWIDRMLAVPEIKAWYDSKK